MNSRLLGSITVTLLILGLFQITLNLAPNVMSEPGSSRKEVWKVVEITNPLPYNTSTAINVTVNSRTGIYIACSPNLTNYFANLTYWNSIGYPTTQPFEDYWVWLDGNRTHVYHWGEMNWYVSNGGLASVSYNDIQHWGDMYFDSGSEASYTTFMGNTYMADNDSVSSYNDPDIITPEAFWQGNQIRMINSARIGSNSKIQIAFKIVLTEPGDFTFNIIASSPDVTITHDATWTVAGPSTLLVPSTYTTIQAAIDASSPGDTILVSSGTYNEALRIDKPLTILGGGSATTFINGTDVPLSAEGLVRITSNSGNVRFSGFTVCNASGFGASNVRIGIFTQSNLTGPIYTISENKIYGTGDASEAQDYGFYAQSGNENIIFRNNVVSGTGANNIVLEKHTGYTEISHNTLDAGAYGTDSIFIMTYGGVDVTTLQNISYNTFDMGTGEAFDYAHRATGISFSSVYPVLGSGPEANFTYMVVSGNTFNNLKSNRRGIGFWNAGTEENLVSPFITNNTINGVAGSDDNYGIDFYGLTNNATIFNNTISGTEVAIYLRNGDAPGTKIRYNNIAGNVIGVDWTLGATRVEASYNWWGNETGPHSALSQYPDSLGDNVTDNVAFEPWLIKPYPPLVPITVVHVAPQLVTLWTPSLGTTFTVNVEIANATMLYGFQLELRWNTTYLNLTSFSYRVPSVWGTNYALGQSIANYTLGSYSLGMTARSPAPHFNGSTIVATLTFKSILEPIYPDSLTSNLTLQGVKLADINATVLPRLVYNGTYLSNSTKPKILFREEYSASKVPTEFDAYINITYLVNLTRFSFTVTYDTSALTVLNVSAPAFSGNPIISLTWNPPTGEIFVNVTGISPPVNGSMVLAKVRFSVKGFVWSTETSELASKLNFTLDLLNDGSIAHDVINGTYIYRPVPGDLDRNGLVDIVDLMIVAGYFGTYTGSSPYWEADLNHDSWVDILDIILVARNFGRTTP